MAHDNPDARQRQAVGVLCQEAALFHFPREARPNYTAGMDDPTPAPDDKPDPATPFDAFQDFARRVFTVPKAEIDKLEAAYQRERAKKKAKRGPKPG